MFRKATSAAAIAAVLVGCTAVTSKAPQDGKVPVGLVYHLPSSLIPLNISANGTNLTVTGGALEFIPDERHAYVLNHVYSPAHAEKMTFEVSDGLLNTVDLVSDGRLDEIIVKAAKSAALFENLSNAPVSVYSDKVRVDALAADESGPDGRSALQRLNETIRSNLANAKGIGPGLAATFNITVEREFPESASAPSASPEQCRVGVCYRTLVSYIMRITFNGRTQVVRFAAPNGSPTYAAPVERGLFSKWLTTVTLTNGMVTKYEQDIQGSELEEFVEIPADFVAAQIEGLTQKGNLLQSRFDLEKKRLDLAKQRADLLNTSTAESFGGANDFLFQASFGKAVVSAEHRIGSAGIGQIVPDATDPSNPSGSSQPDETGRSIPGSPGNP